MRRQLKEIGRPLVGLVAIAGVIALLAPSFRQWAAVEDVLESSAVLFIMCTGMTIAPDILREAIGAIPRGPQVGWAN